MNLQYANQSVLYTTQFVASMSEEEVVLDCGSVVVAADNDQRCLPIHTRLALPWSAVERLHGLLGELIQSRGSSPMATNAGDESARASLPPLSIPSVDSPGAKV